MKENEKSHWSKHRLNWLTQKGRWQDTYQRLEGGQIEDKGPLNENEGAENVEGKDGEQENDRDRAKNQWNQLSEKINE